MSGYTVSVTSNPWVATITPGWTMTANNLTVTWPSFDDGWLSVNEIRRIEGIPKRVTIWDCFMFLCGRRPGL